MLNKSIFLLFSLASLFLFYGNCSEKSFHLSENSSTEYVEVLSAHGEFEHPSQKIIETIYDPLIGDRLFIGKKLKALFGQGTSTVNIIDANVIRQNLFFGGGCSIYENYAIEINKNDAGARVASAADANGLCSQESSSTYPMVPGANVGRQAWVIRACNLLVNDEPSFLFFMKRIDLNSSSSYLPDVNSETLRLAIQHFYGASSPIPDGLVQSFEILVNDFDYKDEAWKTVIYSICISSYWQQI